MSSNIQHLSAKLNALYAIIQKLTLVSSEEDFQGFAAFFAANCTVYLKSMNLHRMPGIGRVGVIEDMKEVLKKVHIEDRKTLKYAVTADEKTLFCETVQRINVMGDILDPFYETEIATFDDKGLITELRVYSCWSPIVRILQDKTGVGPMAEGDRREEWERMVQGMVQEKMRKQAERKEYVCCA